MLLFFGILNTNAKEIPIEKRSLVGEQIVEFIPFGFDQNKTPSLILKEEPKHIGTSLTKWNLVPEFNLVNGKACATLNIPSDVSLYGGGEVTGPLLRNGQYIKLWNTDTGAYSVENGKRLYQTHPWVMGVRPDGTAFGILFDTTWKSELFTDSEKIEFNTEGDLFRIYIIDRDSPKDVLKGLAELTGTINMPPRWSLGYHQCRFSYKSEERVREIADTFRLKQIPCDVIWMDIDYMNGYRVFTFNDKTFSNPKKLNTDLRKKGFKSVYMIDPGVKYDPGYGIYDSGTANDVWVKKPNGEEYHGKVWPGDCVFPDFTSPETRDWWSNLYKDFMANNIDGVWNDMNEPAVNDNDLPKSQIIGTMPYDTPHKGGGNLPAGPHLLYHNAYGRLMVEASLKGIIDANPDKRPFLLTRANLLGGQRYAATWTGDNSASWEHMKLSVPMSLTLGLSGQPYSGPDIGGFLNNTDADLWANWLGFGVFLPFVRGHACEGTNNKEPWAFGSDIENTSRIALERRYRLLPYLYTLFYESHKTGLPIISPVFFADSKDQKLRGEEEAFLLGDNLLVVPAYAKNPILPKGIWETLTLVDGDQKDKYQATLKLRGGSIVPAGKIIQNTEENSLDPLTLYICLDSEGKANGELYWDAGDGWSFKDGDYFLMNFSAQRKNNSVKINMLTMEGKRVASKDIKAVKAVLLLDGEIYEGKGSLKNGINISIK